MQGDSIELEMRWSTLRHRAEQVMGDLSAAKPETRTWRGSTVVALWFAPRKVHASRGSWRHIAEDGDARCSK